MRTSEEIYHRVRWDARFDPARFVFGVEQRGAAVKRIPLPVFVPGGEIPWHRVVFVEADGNLVWDRATGLDRIDESGFGRAQIPRLLRAPYFTAGTPHDWHPVDGWQPGATGTTRVTREPGDRIRVLTWNTLWDRYDSDRIHTARRRPMLLAALERADADVIALQEVEPELLAMVLAAAWVRAGYTVNTDPRGKEVDQGGLLLLSRLPVREAGSHVLGRHKALAAMTVDTGAGPLVVATTHLSSDHSENGADRRRDELARIAEGLASVDGDLILVGDFNDGNEDLGSGPAVALDLLDAWTIVHGSDGGKATFDPIANPLAAVSSLSDRASRLDRILLRGDGPIPTAAALYGDVAATDGLYISDHFGVRVDLELVASIPGMGEPRAVLDVPPTARTALAWIPPRELWPSIQAIRQEHDPQAHDWPPHVNVLFGFAAESEFERAAELLGPVLAKVTPFATRMDGVHTFGHRDDATLWLDPAAGTEKQWSDLRRAVQSLFPQCRGRAEGFTPHLTLGRTHNPQRTALQCAARLTAMTAEVGELVLLSRHGDEPMRTRAKIELGTGKLRWSDEIADDDLATAWAVPGVRRDALAERTVLRVRRALPAATVHVVGSRRMACALPTADLDLIAVFSDAFDPAEVRSAIVAELPGARRARRVIGARVPGLRFTIDGLDVDLSLVVTGQMPPTEAVRRRTELGEAAATTLSAVSDADAIRLAVGDQQQNRFASLARGIKAWAKARGLDSAPFGGLPGVAWSVLAARVTVDAARVTVDAADTPDLTAQDLLQRFFATWAAWDWHEPITLDATPATPPRPTPEPVTVLTPSEPIRNCAMQVSTAGRDLLAAELYRAWEITDAAAQTGADPWAELLATPPLHRRHAAWAVLTIRSDQAEGFDRVHGKVRGRMLNLLAALADSGAADVHAWPRPFDSGPTAASYAIGLGHNPPDRAVLAQIARHWGTGLSGVAIDLVEGGGVPTLR